MADKDVAKTQPVVAGNESRHKRMDIPQLSLMAIIPIGISIAIKAFDLSIITLVIGSSTYFASLLVYNHINNANK